MAEYREKSKRLQAVQFIEGKPWPDGVLREPAEHSKAYIELNGEMISLDEGDYICTQGDEKFVLTKTDFEEAYEAVPAQSDSSTEEKYFTFIGEQVPAAKVAKNLGEAIGFLTAQVQADAQKISELSKKNPKVATNIDLERENKVLKGQLNKIREEHRHAGGR